MTVPQVRTLSARRLYKAYKHSNLGIEAFGARVRGFHPELRKTTVKQLTRWHSGQRPRNAELVVAAYMEITGKPEAFFYTTAAEDDEESRMRRLRELAVASSKGEDVSVALLELAAASEPISREFAL